MTDNNVENITDDVQPESEARTNSDNKVSVKTGIPKVYIMSLFFMVILVAGSLYLNSKIQGVVQTTQSLSDRAGGNNESIDRRLREMQEDIERLSTQTKALQNTITDLHQQQSGNNEDWALAEVEYLLIIATHRILLEQDVETALAAMNAGLLRIESMSNPDLVPLREQLVSDINNLKAVNTVDIAGLSIYLADLIDRANKLPTRKTVTSDVGNGEMEITMQNSSDSGQNNFMSSIWRELKSLIVIKKTGEVKQELLLPDQEYFLYQNLRLELENARLSVLKHDTENFRTSIALTMNWLNQYFDVSDNGVMNVLDTLKQMSTVKLDPELPDINSSLETLRALIHSRETANSLVGPNNMAFIS